MSQSLIAEFASQGIEMLRRDDPTLYELLDQEYHRQTGTLTMVAASSVASPSVLACEGTVVSNVTTEGYPGARFHAGCKVVDEIEQLAIARACKAFRARHANVQPHSGSSANEIIMFNLLKPGDTVLGLELNSGGHLTHGARASVSGQYFNAVEYGLTEGGFLNYEQVYELAMTHRPKLIVCGASAYPREINFKRFREIADEAGAYLLADISHIAGLVAAGLHPSPIDHAHFTTTSTYKQLFGPRGGLILLGRDSESPAPSGKGALADMVQRAVFPFFQGTPNLNTIAAKARALAIIATPWYEEIATRILNDARALACRLLEYGYHVLTGGTDNHIVLVNVLARGVTGVVAERALEECNIVINKNKIPGDTKTALVTSGMRLGTNSLALRGLGPGEMFVCADLIHSVLTSVRVKGDIEYELDNSMRAAVRCTVRRLCEEFPYPYYPADRFEAARGRLLPRSTCRFNRISIPSADELPS
jgi:glycine hydroxymethyltransferase